jgi:hypothetical protein
MKKKLSLAFLFALGLFAIMIAIIRTVLFLNQATLFVVIIWSSTETTVCFLVANGPALRPLFFRGNTFESSGKSSNPAGFSSSPDAYRMTPKETGVVSTVSVGHLDDVKLRPESRHPEFANHQGILRAVEVTITEEIKTGGDGRFDGDDAREMV